MFNIVGVLVNARKIHQIKIHSDLNDRHHMKAQVQQFNEKIPLWKRSFTQWQFGLFRILSFPKWMSE
jgi:hypothetical protein